MTSFTGRILAPIFLFAVTGALAPLRSHAADTIPAATDAYQTAVNQYVEAAAKEVAAMRAELATHEKKNPKKASLAEAKAAASDCAELVERLRTSTAATFDPLKVQYERRRNELVKELSAVRGE
jgi:hypothetical protein